MNKFIKVGFLVAAVHGLEDVALVSMGRFLPVPVWAMYAIGIGVSVTILTVLINSFTERFKT